MALAPFLAGSAFYTLLNFATRSHNLHHRDGTFDLSAPFPLTIAHSSLRMLWFWGFLALAVLLWWRETAKLVLGAFVWMVVTLLPYSFLTYMTRVPSRHTYWASAALAVLAGAAFSRFGRTPRLTVAVGIVLVAHNAGYLWTKKHGQYLERAEPTEALLREASTHERAVVVERFPYHAEIAKLALELRGVRAGGAVFLNPAAAPPDAVRFCSGQKPEPPLLLADTGRILTGCRS